ncbi:hypothetical protein AU381_22955 [Sinorhizobium glycinis]|uniref:Uncharacterized protein n=1 Tax=Sinorhizobium glycinis TaxID=1472378 RepID=A0A178XT24_9HYPH|nr:hypothetical protein AU381_22955 [Sinorhizobium glycinis]
MMADKRRETGNYLRLDVTQWGASINRRVQSIVSGTDVHRRQNAMAIVGWARFFDLYSNSREYSLRLIKTFHRGEVTGFQRPLVVHSIFTQSMNPPVSDASGVGFIYLQLVFIDTSLGDG